MVQDIVYRGIVLLPDDRVSQQAISISQLINRQIGTQFSLNAETMLPHITVHQIALPAENEERLLRKVRELAADCQPLTIELTQLGLFLEKGIWWNVGFNGALSEMHPKLVKKLDALREGYIIDQHASLLTGDSVDIGPARRKALGCWGNMLCMDTYAPHITITSCRSVLDASAAIEGTSVEPMSFVASSLNVVDIGPFGSCSQVLCRFPFGV